MIKKYKMIFTFLLILLLISTVFTANTLAKDPVIKLKQQVSLYWDSSDSDDPIIPRDELKELNVTFDYSFNHGLSFSEGMYLNYVNYKDLGFTVSGKYPDGYYSKAKIELDIIDSPSWCHATFRHPQAVANLSPSFINKIPLYIILDEDAPAYEQGYLLVEAFIRSPPAINYISSYKKEFNLTFTTSFYPVIDVNLPDVNVKEIGPQESAEFPLEISNIGNDKTIVNIKVDSLPDGWAATVTDSLLLEKESSKKAQLSVKPPRDFGYKNEVGIVRLKLTPTRAYDMSEEGDDLTISFLIKSKGFSVEGGNLNFSILVIVFVLLLFLIVGFFLKKKTKNRI